MKNKVIKFIFTKTQAVFISGGLFILAFPIILGSETLSLTTFYPDSYGAFSTLRATRSLIVGDVTSNYIEFGNNASNMINTISSGTNVSIETSGGSIYLVPLNQVIRLGQNQTADTYVENFCTWKIYAHYSGDAGKTQISTKNYCPRKNMYAIAVGSAVGTVNNNWNETLSGSMLCCRFSSNN